MKHVQEMLSSEPEGTFITFQVRVHKIIFITWLQAYPRCPTCLLSG